MTAVADRAERREAFRQDTLTAWADFCRSGLQVSAAEADAWLAQLEQGKDIEPPLAQRASANPA